MRKIKEDELEHVAEFFVEQFENLEFFTYMSKGLTNPSRTLKLVTMSETSMFMMKGDVYIYDDNITSVISGIPSKNFNFINQLLFSFKARKFFNQIDKSDRDILVKNYTLMQAIHKKNWHLKYTKKSYYIAQFAVAKSAKGTGVFREMITRVINECEQKNLDIVLETFTEANVAIYEHFGFQLVETHSDPKVPFSEYCFIRKSE